MLLRVRNLTTEFHTDEGVVRAVDGVSFDIDAGETYALVGESGCGKSQTALSILRLVQPPGRTTADAVEFDGRDLMKLDDTGMRDIRGAQISMIFQEPMISLNPVFTCGYQLTEALKFHRRVGTAEARRQALVLLNKVGIAEAERRFGHYPHELSGGMQQRVMIAMALMCGPRLLIADEPTTALDVTIQAQIIALLKELQAREGLSILFITHDLAVVGEVAHRVAVMYASRIVEMASVKDLFDRPEHPYTHGLFRSLPRLGMRQERLENIEGQVPSLLALPTGCAFHPRCRLTREHAAFEPSRACSSTCGVLKRCVEEVPPLREIRPGHWCACWECEGYSRVDTADPLAAGGVTP